MPRLALLVGLDEYDHVPCLSGCEADVHAIGDLLGRHDDNAPNFTCRALLSSRDRISRAELRRQVAELFTKRDAELAIFFFAGHGANTSSGGFLVTQDGGFDDEGLSMAELIVTANRSPARERVIVLDCCHSGAIDQLFGSNANIPLSEGVSILAACRDTETATERNGRGLFTSLVCDALNGGAADVTGAVTVASIYAYVDEVLTGWGQRPLFKANVSKLTSIRRAAAAVSLDRLRKLNRYFPTPEHRFRLDPSFEPTEEPRHAEHEAAFGDLQQYRAARLLTPDDEEHMYYAAMRSKTCSLTPLGRFYWRRVQAGKI
jgi:hypothetical protein